jgi:hypothetical protein
MPPQMDFEAALSFQNEMEATTRIELVIAILQAPD